MLTFSRRNFLKVTGGLTVATALSTTLAQRVEMLDELHVAVADYDSTELIHGAGQITTTATEQIVPTVCSLCPSGCGLWARVVDGRLVKLEGSPLHPVNLGTLCPKGQSAPELLYNPDRIQGPLRRVGARGAGEWESISWETALSLVAQRLAELRGRRTSGAAGLSLRRDARPDARSHHLLHPGHGLAQCRLPRQPQHRGGQAGPLADPGHPRSHGLRSGEHQLSALLWLQLSGGGPPRRSVSSPATPSCAAVAPHAARSSWSTRARA